MEEASEITPKRHRLILQIIILHSNGLLHFVKNVALIPSPNYN